jgi:3-hydroxyacyl-[acyl-carrier-protein] dehydratase
MPPELILDPTLVDTSCVLADREQLRAVNPQRFEMEQLDAIVLMDAQLQVIVGYKDVRSDEFWVKGHMPDYPLLPGVLMCEAAAQLASYYTVKCGLLTADFIGFGGMENVKFRSAVKPGDRLLLIGKVIRMNRRQTIFNVQGFVASTMVFHADIIGMQMSKKESPQAQESPA